MFIVVYEDLSNNLVFTEEKDFYNIKSLFRESKYMKENAQPLIFETVTENIRQDWYYLIDPDEFYRVIKNSIFVYNAPFKEVVDTINKYMGSLLFDKISELNDVYRT